jgi:hypothetical protein
VAPCSLVEVDGRFRGEYCLHHQGDHDDGVITYLWNVGLLPHDNTAPCPRKLSFSFCICCFI